MHGAKPVFGMLYGILHQAVFPVLSNLISPTEENIYKCIFSTPAFEWLYVSPILEPQDVTALDPIMLQVKIVIMMNTAW